MAKKRKYDDESTEISPAKRSKSSQRSERRRERLKEGHQKPKDTTVLLGDHETKPRSKQETKRAERKQLRKAAASGTLVTVEDQVEDTGTILPEDAVDYDRANEERERRKQRNKALKKLRHRQEQEQSVSKASKRQKQKQQPDLKPSATSTVSSDQAAGRFIDHDPIFVRDASGEDYLIAAVARELQVLSIETSLLVRTLPAPEGTTIKAFAVESPESNLVHIAYNNGGVSLWDWTNDLPAWSIVSATGEVEAISAVRLNDDDEEAVVSLVTSVDGVNVVKVHDLDIHRAQKAVHSIQVLGKAEYVLARGRDVVVIGKRKDDKKYAWMELPLTKPTTCMDARMVQAPSGSKKQRQPQLQLAIGNEDGQIQLYDDVSSLLSQGQQQALPAPRILHWHRSAVSSIKFSPDGNYLISGGKETVLVIWQLETGRKQYLPHLTSEIERITVNPQGDRYALHMGDNSIMVLSTAELKPVANFAGLQMPTMGAQLAKGQAVALDPKNPKQLLLTVPPTQPKSANEFAPRPYLQTFDLRTARHVTRQALTRNNATDFNIGPEGNTIFPPDVHHLALSQNGEWMATVDEWMPPASDLLHLAPDPAGIEEARRWRRQVYLKFWHWDASLEMWTLSTRADHPHARAGSQSHGQGRVVALVSDPSRNAFATVGEDDCVKIWKPKTRKQSGVAMRDAQDFALIDFACKRSVQLSSNKTRADAAHEHNSAVAAYSGDGSLLAVSSSSPITSDESIPAITFIDTATGAVKLTTTGLSDGTAITAIAFLGQYFIIVTHKAAFIWDLVNIDTLVQKIKLPHLSGAKEPLLAVSEADQMFAIVTAGNKSRVEVHSTRHTNRLYKQEFETAIVKILGSEKGSRGFVLLFADATIRTLLPTGSTSSVSALQAELGVLGEVAPTTTADAGAEILDAERDEAWADLVASNRAVKLEGDAVQHLERPEEEDRPVVTPEQLADALGVGESTAMPPVRDMFQAVVGLFKRPMA